MKIHILLIIIKRFLFTGNHLKNMRTIIFIIEPDYFLGQIESGLLPGNFIDTLIKKIK